MPTFQGATFVAERKFLAGVQALSMYEMMGQRTLVIEEDERAPENAVVLIPSDPYSWFPHRFLRVVPREPSPLRTDDVARLEYALSLPWTNKTNTFVALSMQRAPSGKFEGSALPGFIASLRNLAGLSSLSSEQRSARSQKRRERLGTCKNRGGWYGE